MAIHTSILAGKIPWEEKPDRLQSGIAKSQTLLSMHTHTECDLELRRMLSIEELGVESEDQPK